MQVFEAAFAETGSLYPFEDTGGSPAVIAYKPAIPDED